MSAERVGEDDVAGLPRMMSTYDLTLDDFQHAFDPKIFIRKLTSPIFGFDEEVHPNQQKSLTLFLSHSESCSFIIGTIFIQRLKIHTHRLRSLRHIIEINT
eukprot:1373358-Amorphochlora_amoeboformis.AAC.1